jgi:hypothetical protein
MKNVAIFWDITPCSPYVKQCFEVTYHAHLHGMHELNGAIPEDGNIHNHRCENLRSYIWLIFFPFRNCLKEEDDLRPLLFNFVLQCATPSTYTTKLEFHLMEAKLITFSMTFTLARAYFLSQTWFKYLLG